MQGKSRWKHGLASTLVLIVASVGMWFLLGAKCIAAVVAQPSALIPLPFLLFVAYISMVLLHHLCRIIVGKMVGMRLLTFSSGPFAIRRTRRGLRPVWNDRQPTILMGSTVFAPIGLDRLRQRCIWLIGSGPVAAIVCGLFFALIVRVSDPARAPIDTLFAASIALVGVLFGVRLLLPIRIERTTSNGMLLWDAFRGRPTAESLLLVSSIGWEATQGLRPRDWPADQLELALRLTEKTNLPERVIACLLGYYWTIDLGREDAAADYLTEAVARADPRSKFIFSRVMLEHAFFQAFFRRDAARAQTAFSRISSWKGIPHFSWLRVSAALAFAEGRIEECHRQAIEALEILRTSPVKHRLVIEWLEQLVSASEARC
jgi:hypothetical protein